MLVSKKGSSKKKSSKGSSEPLLVCAGCKNFKPGKGGAGTCMRKDKKRKADEEACGSFKPK